MREPLRLRLGNYHLHGARIFLVCTADGGLLTATVVSLEPSRKPEGDYQEFRARLSGLTDQAMAIVVSDGLTARFGRRFEVR